MDDDRTLLAICIGTFDSAGFPITTQQYLGNYVQLAFQAICLNMLISRTLGLGTNQSIRICGKDGESIRIEHHHQGFIAYLEQAEELPEKTSEAKTSEVKTVTS